MPELWLVLDKRDLPFDDYLDLRCCLSVEDTIDSIAEALVLQPFSRFIGLSKDEWDAQQAYMVEIGAQAEPEPWGPAMRPWISAERGIVWCATVLSHLDRSENPFPTDWDCRAFVMEELGLLARILQQAKTVGAAWGLMRGA